jgi:hypothetical protein
MKNVNRHQHHSKFKAENRRNLGNIDTSITHDCSGFVQAHQQNVVEVKLVSWAQAFLLSEMMQLCKCFPNTS